MTKYLMTKIYLTEASNLLEKITKQLKKDNIEGFTVYRAISGAGTSGEHTSTLLYPSLNLPIVIEFFDLEEKVKKIIADIKQLELVKHIITWPVALEGNE